MNILLVVDKYPPCSPGGVWEVVKNLKEHFELKGHKAFVLTTGKKQKGDQKAGIYRTSGPFWIALFINSFRLIWLSKKLKPDVIHLHQPMSVLFIPLKKIFGLPKLVFTFHTSNISSFRATVPVVIEGKRYRLSLYEIFEKYILFPAHVFMDFLGYFFADKVTCVSDGLKEVIHKEMEWLLKREIETISNGLNIRSSFNSECSKNYRKKHILYVGALRSLKRPFHLLHAFRNCLKSDPSLRLVYVGGGRGYENKMKAAISSLSLTNSVDLIGQIEEGETVKYFKSCKILCIPSAFDSFGLVVLKALNSSQLVVSSDKVFSAASLPHSGKILTFKCDDVGDLTRQLKNALLLEIKTECFSEDLIKLSWSHLSPKYLGIFN